MLLRHRWDGVSELRRRAGNNAVALLLCRSRGRWFPLFLGFSCLVYGLLVLLEVDRYLSSGDEGLAGHSLGSLRARTQLRSCLG